MRILIYEHICGGGMQGQPLPTALVNAGAGMLQAVIEDFVQAGCEVTTTLDPRIKPLLPDIQVLPVTTNNIESVVETLAMDVDATLIIAPEIDSTLHRWAERLVAWNVPSLGSSPDAIAVCTDKLKLFHHLKKQGIRTPQTIAVSSPDLIDLDAIANADPSFQFVVKPRDGAGCESTHVWDRTTIPNTDDFSNSQQAFVTQPKIVGQPVSVSFIVTPTQIHPLLVGDQHVTGQSVLHYRGGTIPTQVADTDTSTAIIAIARQTIEAVDGLQGFVGIDLIVEEATGDPWVIEINPRLTVSYCALRELSHVNLAQAMLEQAVPDRWRMEAVTFDAGGCMMEALA